MAIGPCQSLSNGVQRVLAGCSGASSGVDSAEFQPTNFQPLLRRQRHDTVSQASTRRHNQILIVDPADKTERPTWSVRCMKNQRIVDVKRTAVCTPVETIIMPFVQRTGEWGMADRQARLHPRPDMTPQWGDLVEQENGQRQGRNSQRTRLAGIDRADKPAQSRTASWKRQIIGRRRKEKPDSLRQRGSGDGGIGKRRVPEAESGGTLQIFGRIREPRTQAHRRTWPMAKTPPLGAAIIIDLGVGVAGFEGIDDKAMAVIDPLYSRAVQLKPAPTAVVKGT